MNLKGMIRDKNEGEQEKKAKGDKNKQESMVAIEGEEGEEE